MLVTRPRRPRTTSSMQRMYEQDEINTRRFVRSALETPNSESTSSSACKCTAVSQQGELQPVFCFIPAEELQYPQCTTPTENKAKYRIMLHSSKIPLIQECCLGYCIMIREITFFCVVFWPRCSFFYWKTLTVCWLTELKGFNFSKTEISVGIEVQKIIPVLG